MPGPLPLDPEATRVFCHIKPGKPPGRTQIYCIFRGTLLSFARLVKQSVKTNQYAKR